MKKLLLKKIKSLILYSIVLLFPFFSYSQEYSKHIRFPLWTFHTDSTTIWGISIGAYGSGIDNKRYVITNGVRFEIPGYGIILPLVPQGYLSDTLRKKIVDSNLVNTHIGVYDFFAYSEIVNGINVSTGSFGYLKCNGLTIAGVIQAINQSNGITLTLIGNSIAYTNGIQSSIVLNESIKSNGLQAAIARNITMQINGIQFGAVNTSYTMNGIQIGLYNESFITRGLQFGIWNINEKRSFPIFNWNFY